MRAEEGSAIVMNTENMEILEVEINGDTEHLYISQGSEQSNCITGYDARSEIQFMIEENFEQEGAFPAELIAITLAAHMFFCANTSVLAQCRFTFRFLSNSMPTNFL